MPILCMAANSWRRVMILVNHHIGEVNQSGKCQNPIRSCRLPAERYFGWTQGFVPAKVLWKYRQIDVFSPVKSAKNPSKFSFCPLFCIKTVTENRWLFIKFLKLCITHIEKWCVTTNVVCSICTRVGFCIPLLQPLLG